MSKVTSLNTESPMYDKERLDKQFAFRKKKTKLPKNAVFFRHISEKKDGGVLFP